VFYTHELISQQNTKPTSGDQREETIRNLKNRRSTLLRCTKALTIPVTYLILFVSLIVVISATYSFAVVKITARGALVRASVAKENLLLLDGTIRRIAWSCGSSETATMENGGGILRVTPNQARLMINITDEQTLNELILNANVGRISYELQPSELDQPGLFMKGDNRPIVNQSTSTTTQLRFSPDKADEILLNYRPSATAMLTGSQDGKPLNVIRLSIVTLNSSQPLAVSERSSLRVKSLNVTTATFNFEVDQSMNSIALKANLDGSDGIIWLPLSSSENGAIITCQIVICSVRIQLQEA
jgi:hypothetical protein